MKNYTITIVSEDSVLVEWQLATELPSPADAMLIAALAERLVTQHADHILNVTPAYRTLLVQFDVLTTDLDGLHDWINSGIKTQLEVGFAAKAPVEHQIPTYYDAAVAADLAELCAARRITVEQLIEAHTSTLFTVYSVGFQPGFAYLGYVPESIATPRHRSFRGKVPAGSVGIADRQTAIYPLASPGGWQIIGRTPMTLLENHRAVLQTGDKVQFVAIDRSEYIAQGGALADRPEPVS